MFTDPLPESPLANLTRRVVAAGVRPGAPLLAAALAACSPSPHASPVPPPPSSSLVIYELAGDLYAIPASGGAPTPLAATADTEAFVALAGDRVILADTAPGATHATLSAVKVDRTGRVTLAGSSTNETLLAVVDGRAIIGRSFAVAPGLYEAILSAPLAGGEVTVLDEATSVSAAVDAVVKGGVLFDLGSAGVSSVKADGTGRVPLLDTPGEVVAISGTHVAIVGGTDGHAYVVGRDGSGLHDSGHVPMDFFLAVVGDGQSRGQFVGDAFVWSETSFDTMGNESSALYAMDATSGTVTPLDTIGSALVYNPVDTAAGHAVLPAITQADVATVLLADPTSAGHVDLGRADTNTSFAGQAQGRILVQDSSGTLYSYASDGTGAVTLGAHVAFALNEFFLEQDGVLFLPRAVLPVGGRLLFAESDGSGGALRSAAPDGSDVLTLYQGTGGAAVAAVLGTTVVFVHADGDQEVVEAVGIDGAGRHTVLSNAAGATFDMTVGDALVFERTSLTSTELFTVPLAGGAEQPLASGPGHPRAVAAYMP
jgi:hypothetical protein